MHALLLVVSLLSASPSRPWLEEAKEQVTRLEFAQALERLEVARRAPSLEPEVVREVDELRAYCLVALGKWKEAEALWASILKAAPMAEPSRSFSSPKVLRVYEQAKKQVFPRDFVALEPVEGAGALVRVRVVDPWRRATGVFLVFSDGSGWSEVAMSPDEGLASATLPERGRRGFYVEARGPTGVVASLGSAGSPLSRAPEQAVALTPRADAASTPPTTPHEPGPAAVTTRATTPGATLRAVLGVTALSLAVVSAGLATWLAISGHQLRLAARDESKPPGDFASTAIAAERDGMTRQSWAIGLFIGSGVAAIGGSLLLAW
jgi:hypothetical protein